MHPRGMRRWSAVLAACALALSGAACGDDEEETTGGAASTPAATSSAPAEKFAADTTMGKIQKKGEITIGVKYDVPPFGFKNPSSGEIEGFDIDFGKAVADALGVKPKYIEAISDNRIPFITDGTADLLAVATATSLCDRLLQGGVEHLHFYTLNKPGLTRDVCLALGLRPREAAPARLRAVA